MWLDWPEWKKESLGYHVKSSHVRAVDAKLAKDLRDKNENTPLQKGFQKADENILLKMDKLYSVLLGKKERPFTDFKDLLMLQKSNGLEMGETYYTDKAAK